MCAITASVTSDPEKLIPFFVTRQIFTGSGRVGAASPQDAWIQMDRLIVPRATLHQGSPQAMIPFQISQRADHIREQGKDVDIWNTAGE